MALTPRLRKLALTAHVTASVGWLGAVIAFLTVLFKLAINLVATIVLLLYMQTLAYLAGDAAETPLPSRGLHGLQDPSPTLHAAAALLLLLAATTLAIYKPRGRTRYGQRKQH